MAHVEYRENKEQVATLDHRDQQDLEDHKDQQAKRAVLVDQVL